MVPPLEKFSSVLDKPSRTRTSGNRATQTPNDFLITTELVEWAAKQSIKINLDLETEKFLNHHRAKNSKFSCWQSAWRNWMLRAEAYAEEKKLRQPPPPVNSNQLDWDDTSWRLDLGL
ncbi:hypothetical protein [Zooshikella ganghwensis]|nr:hypothetical protein [Zooshikella ganghwensis]